ncbi:hypothetical protein ACFXG4_51630 [Nocardia sp. NPDC059246]|uniref:hypothetical protein n=1 Tax=unclassified Nocardia TaxID=2637762 RepID=UPI00369356CE
MDYFELSKKYKNPTPAQQRELFEYWWDSKQPYRDATVANGGPVRDKEQAFYLFTRRWKPVRSDD